MRANRLGLVCLLLSFVLLVGCASTGTQAQTSETEESPVETSSDAPVYVDEVALDEVALEDEAVALSAAPAAALPDTIATQATTAAANVIVAEASGKLVKTSSKATIDYSNTSDGYVMVKYTASTTKRLKAQVQGPTATYTYNINPGEWTVFPLSDGNGSYQFKVFENVSDTKYSMVASVSQNVTLNDEFAPFIRPNQYVDYTAASKTVAKAQELTQNLTDPLVKVEAVYNYVVNNMTYDKQKAATVTSGYLPVLDTVLEAKKGICFDYASLMTGMLRSQGIPCKLVIGYAGTAYHAWINVWSAETGWIDGAIYFNGAAWQRMDPTFASTGKQSEKIMAYIGDGKNYTAKYLY